MKDVYCKKKIEDYIINLMNSSGLVPWRCPWIAGAADKAFKGKEYNGVNAVTTAFARAVMGKKSRIWMTKTKIEELNGKKYNTQKKRWERVFDCSSNKRIKAESKGVPIIHWNWVQKLDENKQPMFDEDNNPIEIPFLKYYYVFNGEDIDGFDPTPFEPQSPKTDINIHSCEEFQKKILELYKNHPKVQYGGDQACYIPKLDVICLPVLDSFKSVTEYASTLAHELAHSTGAKERLKRNFGTRGTSAYAKEELVAEFASAMILDHMGIHEMPVIQNNAAYIKEWTSQFQKSPGILFDAISEARKAKDYILGITNSLN